MIFFKIGRLVAAFFVKTSYKQILSTLAGYAIASYLCLWFAKETDLIVNIVDFIYWLVVTGSTVGYGDMSPSTPAGKLVVSFFIIPIGLTIFAGLLSKLGVTFVQLITIHEKGLMDLHLNNHCVILGWDVDRTTRLIDMIIAGSNESNQKIVLVTDKNISNPLPDKVEFVKVESYSHEPSMRRAAIENASRVVIDLQLDDATLTAALLCRKLNPDCHKTAYFKDENIGKLLLEHCPNVESIPSISIELLARSTVDPGSAQLHQQLLDSSSGMNQFAICYNKIHDAVYSDLFKQLKDEYDATLIGVKSPGESDIAINAKLDSTITKGDSLFYIAKSRLAANIFVD